MSQKMIMKQRGIRNISWSDAETMMNEYADGPSVLMIGGKLMRGLSVDATELRQVLKDETSDVEKILILFGVKNRPHAPDEFTTIIAPVVSRDGNEMIDRENALDFFDPCPSACADLITQ